MILYINKNIKKKKILRRDILYIIIPIIIGIIFTFCLNYQRFGNIFEYGYSYNIRNLDNYKNRTHTIGYYLKNILDTLVMIPSVDLFKFPFFKMDIANTNYFISSLKYNYNILGLISYPIILVLIFKKFLKYDTYKNNTLNCFINITVIFSFILLLLNYIYNGISEVYTLESKFLLIICSVLMMLKLIENNSDKLKIPTEQKIFLILSAITICIIIPISISTDRLYLHMTSIKFVNSLKNTFMFWI